MVNRAHREHMLPVRPTNPLLLWQLLNQASLNPIQGLCSLQRGNWGHDIYKSEGNQGYINLERALETSSNMFFYKVGVQTGIDNIVKWAKIFGFGRKTGIEIGEQIGSLASERI